MSSHSRAQSPTDTATFPVRIPVEESTYLNADLSVPVGARSVVVFVHGSGSSRYSPRNRAVARVLEEAGIATLLLDLLTEREEEIDAVTGEYRFDIPLLGRRTSAVVDHLLSQPGTRGLPVGLFGASTGAAAALIAAAERPERVTAVVSRGGRVDLAEDALDRVRAPVLLIVGGRDPQVLELNRQAADQLTAAHRLEVVPGATHLFAENNALETVALSARRWFTRPDPDAGQPADGS
jgi:dienelactone hydrolase